MNQAQNVYVVEAKRPYVDYVLGLNDIGLQTTLVPLKLAPQLFAGAVDREENATFVVDIGHVDLLNHILDVSLHLCYVDSSEHDSDQNVDVIGRASELSRF
jgi:hypothetical protein